MEKEGRKALALNREFFASSIRHPPAPFKFPISKRGLWGKLETKGVSLKHQTKFPHLSAPLAYWHHLVAAGNANTVIFANTHTRARSPRNYYTVHRTREKASNSACFKLHIVHTGSHDVVDSSSEQVRESVRDLRPAIVESRLYISISTIRPAGFDACSRYKKEMCVCNRSGPSMCIPYLAVDEFVFVTGTGLRTP